MHAHDNYFSISIFQDMSFSCHMSKSDVSSQQHSSDATTTGEVLTGEESKLSIRSKLSINSLSLLMSSAEYIQLHESTSTTARSVFEREREREPRERERERGRQGGGREGGREREN